MCLDVEVPYLVRASHGDIEHAVPAGNIPGGTEADFESFGFSAESPPFPAIAGNSCDRAARKINEANGMIAGVSDIQSAIAKTQALR